MSRDNRKSFKEEQFLRNDFHERKQEELHDHDTAVATAVFVKARTVMPSSEPSPRRSRYRRRNSITKYSQNIRSNGMISEFKAHASNSNIGRRVGDASTGSNIMRISNSSLIQAASIKKVNISRTVSDTSYNPDGMIFRKSMMQMPASSPNRDNLRASNDSIETDFNRSSCSSIDVNRVSNTSIESATNMFFKDRGYGNSSDFTQQNIGNDDNFDTSSGI